MTSSDMDQTVKRTRREVYDARFAQVRNRTVAGLQGRPLQPAAIPVASERPLAAAPSRRLRNWPLWIVVAVGAAALVAAGYLGALVQFGVPRPETPRSIQHTAAPVPQLKPAPSAPQRRAAPVAVEEASALPHASPVEPVRSGATATRARVRSANATAAALATAALERELYGQRSPVLTIRALSPLEAAEPSHAQPSREAVQQALLAMRPDVESCAAGRHGTVEALVSIAGTGRVTSTLIRGDFAGTREGSCMARALRGATFPAFSGPVFKVQFPFVL